MKLTLAEPRYLKDSINIISELVSEGRFKISSNGLELVAMDPANVAMVVFKLLSSCFVEYEIKEPIEIGINLNNLKQMLRRAKPADSLTLEIGADNKLNIIMKSSTTRTFSLPIIEMEDKEQKVPELAFPVIVETNTNVVESSIEDISIVSESVSLLCSPDKMTVKGEGDFSKAVVEIPADDMTTITNDGEVRAKYSVEYLKKMLLGGKLTSRVTLCFDRDYPLKLDFKEVDKVSLSFILAPRVENN